ncbi:NHL repeat-containing protein 3-like [Neoarius graeffei]|uniref:NHL repeat-containing protein 3-like n=1 Tax=Neoarius graeffei TaxID=443677 RepID=UPI00298D256C|nr:NHL repeat-containing protein 3-like [Neoarius graeffei]
MRKKSQLCFISSAMAIIFLVMFVMYSTLNSHYVASGRKRDFSIVGRTLYKLDVSWPKYSEHFTGEVCGVAVDHLAGVVYVAQRGGNIPKVLVFNTDGDFLYAWNTSTLEKPHGIFLANTSSVPSVWITDVGNGPYGHTIKQYSPLGKLLQVLGTVGKAGSGLTPLQFDQPAEIFIHNSTGEIYIVDGDGGMNNRLIKLSQDLQTVWIHGEKGEAPSQFRIPHSVAVDNFQRVWVADRENRRLQVFNSVTGNWLGLWGSCFTDDAPYSVRFTPDQKYLVVAQLSINRVILLEAPPVGNIGQCKVVSSIQLADDIKPHLVDLDQKTGALYVAEVGGQQAQKFVPITSRNGIL